jgi:hypothetical protein
LIKTASAMIAEALHLPLDTLTGRLSIAPLPLPDEASQAVALVSPQPI